MCQQLNWIQLQASTAKTSLMISTNRTIRTRFKMCSRLFWLTWLLLILSLYTVCHSQPLTDLLSSVPDSEPASTCPLSQCYSGSSQISCHSINVINACIRALPQWCHGVLEYHTLNTILQKTKARCSRPSVPVRSGDSFAFHQMLNKRVPSIQSTVTNRNHQMPISNSKFLQYCLSAAYNYTIGSDVTANIVTSSKKTSSQFDLSAEGTNRARKNRKIHHRVHRDIERQNDLNIDNSQTNSKQINTDVQNDFSYKPQQPMTPSLTCIIFGDPHIRTFDSRYQTCNCLGARSLIEHPLFDVQITNTQILDQSNSTGVTKVTVLVRKFSPCAIGNELIYETDSLTQNLPSSTFTDGSVFNFNNLTYISTSLQNKVVTIHLDHIGVRVYISRFSHTNFLNVVIKFRTATSTVKQNLVLNAISPISLCKSGCHPRELVDIESELKNAGIHTKPVNVNSGDEEETNLEQASEENFMKESRFTEDSEDIYEDDDFDDEDVNNPVDFDDIVSYRSNLRPKIRTKKEAEVVLKGRKRSRKNRNNKKKKPDLNEEENSKKKKNPKRFRNIPPEQLKALSSLTLSQLNPERPLSMAAFNNQEPIVSQILMPQNDCSTMIGYYQFTCLYDTVLKGIASTEPHKFAKSFDELRLMDETMSYVSIFDQVNIPSSTSTVTFTINLLLLVVLACYANN